MAAVFAVHLVMVGVFLYLAARAEEGAHIRLWAASWALGAVRYVVGVAGIVTETGATLDRVAYLTVVGSGLLFMAGTYRFLDRELPRGWSIGAALAAVWILGAWACDLAGRPAPFVVETLPPFAFSALVDVWTGAVVLRARTLGGVRHVLGWALVVWGLHRADYPLLRPVEWFAPWGFALAAVLGALVAVGTLLLYFERAWSETRRSEERYRSIFENAIEGMFQLDAAGRFLAANPAMVRLLRARDEEELRGRSFVADVLGRSSDDGPAALAALCAARGEEDVELVRADGERLVASLQLRGTALPEGAPGFEGSVRDVTQARRLRAQLLQAQKLEAVGRLAGGVAHDFNNVLTAIVGSSELAERSLQQGQAPRSELQEIRAASLRAAELTRQLLAFSRHQVEPPRPVDLRGAVEAAAAILERLIGEDIALVVRTPDAPLVVEAGPGQLQQIVLNLAINARDAMPEGGRLEVVLARVPSPEGLPLACLTVSDQGHGIDAGTRARLFEPFFTTKPPGKGTGLGLATVYGTVTALGGRIEVTSAPGEGATFQVFLPTVGGAAERPQPEVQPSRRSSGATVLLVEDDEVVRGVTARMLAAGGHDLLVARSADEGFALARAHPGAIDVLVSDVVMPGGSGVDLARQLRSLHPDLPVLLVSGYDAGELERARGIEGAEFLAKPFSSDRLLDTVRALLARSSGG